MENIHNYIPFLLIVLVAASFGCITLAVSNLLGPKRRNKAKMLAYECGNVPDGEANVRVPIKFYLVALLFLLFDMETVLILMWANVFRTPEIPGFQPYAFCVMVFFMVILVVGFLYEWRKGALKWT